MEDPRRNGHGASGQKENFASPGAVVIFGHIPE
jgi:hypothetical protein